MSYIGEMIREEINNNGMTQDKLGRLVGVDRSMISKYINGHHKIPQDILASIADALDSPRLQILVAGTTTAPVLFDQVKVDFYITASKVIEEMEEAIEDIKQVLGFAYNINSIDELTDKQRKLFNHMIDEIDDVNHACDVFDMAVHELGANLKERNKRNILKYSARGYISEPSKLEAVK